MTEEERELQEGSLNIRIYLYTLFDRIFRSVPDEDLVESLQGDTAWECLQTLAYDQSTELWKGADFLYSLREKPVQPFLEQLQLEYARLFPDTENPPVPLWQTAYQNKCGRLQHLPAVQSFLRTLSGSQESEPYFYEDSLSYQMNMMAALCQESLAAFQSHSFKKLRKLLQAQRNLLDGLLSWVPSVESRLSTIPDCVLYPQLGGILAVFLQSEPLRLDALKKAAAC